MWQFVELQPESFTDVHSLYSAPPLAARSAGNIKRAASRQVWREQIMWFSGNRTLPANETALTTTERDHLCSTTQLEDKSRKLRFCVPFPTTWQFKVADGRTSAPSMRPARSHEQTCTCWLHKTPACKTHPQRERYSPKLVARTDDCSAGRTDGLNVSMSLLRIKNCPHTLRTQRAHSFLFLQMRIHLRRKLTSCSHIFLCCTSAQHRCVGDSDPQGTRQDLWYATSMNSWHVDI